MCKRTNQAACNSKLHNVNVYIELQECKCTH